MSEEQYVREPDDEKLTFGEQMVWASVYAAMYERKMCCADDGDQQKALEEWHRNVPLLAVKAAWQAVRDLRNCRGCLKDLGADHPMHRMAGRMISIPWIWPD